MIDILLSTYNGEKFIHDQIISILDQTYIHWRLFIRDDGSSDDTPRIIKEYSNRYPLNIFVIETSGNIGPTQSFAKLLSISTAKYVMFCDQDDIWLPKKIEITLSKMEIVEKCYPNLPILIHTDLIMTDHHGNTIAESLWNHCNTPIEYEKNVYFLSLHNVVTGCTVMMNRLAVNFSNPISLDASMHDWWIAINVCKYGVIEHIPDQTIKYRRHSKTVTTQKKPTINYYFSKLIQFCPFMSRLKTKFLMLRSLRFKLNFIKLIILQAVLPVNHFIVSLRKKNKQ